MRTLGWNIWGHKCYHYLWPSLFIYDFKVFKYIHIQIFNLNLISYTGTQIAKTLTLILIRHWVNVKVSDRHRSDTFTLAQCLIEINLRVLVIWVSGKHRGSSHSSTDVAKIVFWTHTFKQRSCLNHSPTLSYLTTLVWQKMYCFISSWSCLPDARW